MIINKSINQTTRFSSKGHFAEAVESISSNLRNWKGEERGEMKWQQISPSLSKILTASRQHPNTSWKAQCHAKWTVRVKIKTQKPREIPRFFPFPMWPQKKGKIIQQGQLSRDFSLIARWMKWLKAIKQEGIRKSACDQNGPISEGCERSVSLLAAYAKTLQVMKFTRACTGQNISASSISLKLHLVA